MNPQETTSPNLVGTIPSTKVEAGVVVPNIPETQAINAAQLTPKSPIAIPVIQPTNTAQSISTLADGVKQTALAEQLKADELAKQTAANTSKSDLANTVNDILGIQSSRTQAETAAGLQGKSQTLVNATNQLEASQRAQTNEIRAIQSNSGLTKEQAAQQTQEINRRYAFEQADLALVQSAANRDYATAQSLVDRKIELQLEPLKTKLDYYKELNATDRSAYTEAQKRTLDNIQLEAQKEYNNSQENKKQIKDLIASAIDSRQPELVTELGKLDPNSTTFNQDVGLVASKIKKASDPIFRTLSDGRDVMLDKNGNIIKVIDTPTTKEQKDLLIAQEKAKDSIPVIQGKISIINDAIKSLTDGIIFAAPARGAVGPNPLARFSSTDIFTGATSDFIANVEQVTSKEVLKTLTDLKAAGGTLGALSEKELAILQSASSKIGTWRILDKNGQVTGYKTTEELMKKELNKIKLLSEQAILKASGSNLSNKDLLNMIPTNESVSNKDYFNNI